MTGPAASSDVPPICSAKGCRTVAAWVLAWNNPKLHTPERRKTWAACDTHRESLSQFLTVRGFLRETRPAAGLGPTRDAADDEAGAPQPPIADIGRSG